MGMIPELAIAVLACAMNWCNSFCDFGGFSARSIADRLQDADARLFVTCDGAFRGAKRYSIESN